MEDCLFLNVFSPLATLQALAAAAAGDGPQHRGTRLQRMMHPPITEGGDNKAKKTNASAFVSSVSSSAAEPPSGSELLLPVVVYIHGGGLLTVRKRNGA